MGETMTKFVTAATSANQLHYLASARIGQVAFLADQCLYANRAKDLLLGAADSLSAVQIHISLDETCYCFLSYITSTCEGSCTSIITGKRNVAICPVNRVVRNVGPGT